MGFHPLLSSTHSHPGTWGLPPCTAQGSVTASKLGVAGSGGGVGEMGLKGGGNTQVSKLGVKGAGISTHEWAGPPLATPEAEFVMHLRGGEQFRQKASSPTGHPTPLPAGQTGMQVCQSTRP